MPRRSGSYFTKHSGSGAHRNMHSGKRGHQKSRRHRRHHAPLYARSVREHAVAAVANSERLTRLMLREPVTE